MVSKTAISFAAAAASFALLVAGGAYGQSGSDGPGIGCGEFSLASTGENRVVQHVDLPPEGDSAGDQRVGVRSLIDDNGDEVARLRFIVTNLDPRPDEERAIGHLNNFVVFDDGVLIYEHIYERRGEFSDLTQFTTSSGERYITAGLGAYAGASGIITVDKGEGLSEVYNFSIDCPS